MSFFGKIKKFFNIGGASFKIEAPKKVAQGEKFDVVIKIKGGKQEVINVEKLELELLYEKKFTSGNKIKTQRRTLSTDAMKDAFDLQPGEEKEFKMTLHVDIEKDLSQKGGIMGGLGKLAKFATETKEALKIHLTAHNDYSGDVNAFFYPNLKRD